MSMYPSPLESPAEAAPPPVPAWLRLPTACHEKKMQRTRTTVATQNEDRMVTLPEVMCHPLYALFPRGPSCRACRTPGHRCAPEAGIWVPTDNGTLCWSRIETKRAGTVALQRRSGQGLWWTCRGRGAEEVDSPP